MNPQHSDHDPYDGYADYAEDTRKEVAAGSLAPLVVENRDISSSTWKFFGLLQTLLSFALGWSAASLAFRQVMKSVHGELGFGGLVFLIGAFFIGLIAAILFMAITMNLLHRSPQFRKLLILDLIAVIIILIAIAQPPKNSSNKTNSYTGAISNIKTVSDPLSITKHKEPAQTVEVAYGPPPGIIPPMLAVNDEGIVVEITNKSTNALFVGIARVRRNTKLPEGWDGCRMSPLKATEVPLRWEQFKTGVRFAYQILPYEQLEFVLQEECAELFHDAPIEYRIGSSHEPDRWWSESALHTKVSDYQLDTEPVEE